MAAGSMRSKLIVLIVFLATAAAVAGCGGDNSGGDQGSDTTGAQVNQPPIEIPSKPPPAQAGELSEPQRNLEASGYSVSVLSGHDLENVAKGVTIVASTGISINGKGVHRAIGYAFASPTEASVLQRSIPGLASSLNANRLYFVGERDPNAAFDRMVQVAGG